LEAVNAAKALIEAAAYTVSQAVANDEATVKAWLVSQINALSGMSATGITVTEFNITLDSFTAAVADATDGSFSFTVSLTKGTNHTTASKAGTITKTVTAPVPTYNLSIGTFAGGKVTADKAAYKENETVNLTVTPDEGYELESISAYKTSEATTAVTLAGSGNSRTLTMPAFDVTVTATFKQIPVSPFLTTSLNALGFTADGGEQSFSISSNVTWTVTVPNNSKSWLTIAPASGSNDGMVTVTVDANKAATQRTAAITVSGTGVATQTINVTQAAKKDTPVVIPNENKPVGKDGKGTIDLSLSVPTGATVTGSFEIQFPEGMTLDEELTTLSVELSGNFNLTFSYLGNNTWLITIRSNALRSSTVTEYQKIMDIAYTVDNSVPQGTYEATITNLDFTMSDGVPIEEDLLTVPINVERVVTAINTADNTSFHAYFANNLLKVESSHAELISIYSITGVQLYSVKKNVGGIEIPISSLRGSVYIIKGSVSGTIKVVKN